MDKEIKFKVWCDTKEEADACLDKLNKMGYRGITDYTLPVIIYWSLETKGITKDILVGNQQRKVLYRYWENDETSYINYYRTTIQDLLEDKWLVSHRIKNIKEIVL